MKYWQKSHGSAFGCTKVSPGCRFCWAEIMAARMAGNAATQRLVDGCLTDKGEWSGLVNCHEDRCDMTKLGHTRSGLVIAVNWMGDLFHADVPYEHMHAQLLASSSAAARRWIRSMPPHRFLYLTKRPEQMVERVRMFCSKFDDLQFLEHHYFGVSVCQQSELGPALAALAHLQVGNQWLSMEPIVSPIEMPSNENRIRWIVAGGFGGGGPAAPLETLRHLRDWTAKNGVSFLLKQVGGPSNSVLLDGIVHLEAPWGTIPVKGYS